MKIEASHYDFVEWNPKPLSPGKMFYKPSKKYKTKITDQEIILRSPCRIDVGLLDYSALKFTDKNDYKAGEMSFAGNVYTEVKVKLTKRPEIKNIIASSNLVKDHPGLFEKFGFNVIGEIAYVEREDFLKKWLEE